MTNAARRARRAQVAELLLSVHAQSESNAPEHWNWNRIDALPDWCLLQREDRLLLQRVCGLVLLAPLLRLWIDADRIRMACASVGPDRFAMIIDSTPVNLDGDQAQQALSSLEHWLTAVCQKDVDAGLLRVGACVLCASVKEPELRSDLRRVLEAEFTESDGAGRNETTQSDAVRNDALPPESGGQGGLPVPVAVEALSRATVCIRDCVAVAVAPDSDLTSPSAEIA